VSAAGRVGGGGGWGGTARVANPFYDRLPRESRRTVVACRGLTCGLCPPGDPPCPSWAASDVGSLLDAVLTDTSGSVVCPSIQTPDGPRRVTLARPPKAIARHVSMMIRTRRSNAVRLTLSATCGGSRTATACVEDGLGWGQRPCVAIRLPSGAMMRALVCRCSRLPTARSRFAPARIRGGGGPSRSGVLGSSPIAVDLEASVVGLHRSSRLRPVRPAVTSDSHHVVEVPSCRSRRRADLPAAEHDRRPLCACVKSMACWWHGAGAR